MERLREVRGVLRCILAHHYMEGHPVSEEAGNWLMRWGGWFPDPQVLYGDGTETPLDTGVDGPCADLRAALEEADVLLMLNGATA